MPHLYGWNFPILKSPKAPRWSNLPLFPQSSCPDLNPSLVIPVTFQLHFRGRVAFLSFLPPFPTLTQRFHPSFEAAAVVGLVNPENNKVLPDPTTSSHSAMTSTRLPARRSTYSTYWAHFRSETPCVVVAFRTWMGNNSAHKSIPEQPGEYSISVPFPMIGNWK